MLPLVFRSLISSVFVIGCLSSNHAAEPTAKSASYGRLASGEEVQQFTLTNRQGMQARVIEYGATLTELLVADRDGQSINVILAADSLDGFTKGFPAASIVGRYANRIGHAKFNLDGQEIKVTRNLGEHHLHGGQNNFSKAIWKGKANTGADSASVSLSYVSADGEEGFPGKLETTVTYTLNDRNELSINYHATTDKPTVINLTNHAYFNLAGSGKDILDHELQIYSDKTTVVDKALVPTGEIVSIVGTPLDFLQPQRIGQRIEKLYEAAQGYDHNYIVSGEAGTLRLAARATDPKSGRVMECLTTEPAVQLYTANGFRDNPFPKHGAFCLETQHYPDSPNHAAFPTTTLKPGTKWTSTTVFRFSTKPS